MIAFDTETTGLLVPSAADLHLQPYIIEIYACKFDKDYNFISDLQTFIRPPIPVSKKITEITGITDDMLIGAPSFVQCYDRIADFFLGEDTVYAHNCSFDTGVLCVELQRYGWEYKFPWPKNQICTVEKSFPIKNRRMNLQELHALATGKPEIIGAHRAKTDVAALVKCIMFLEKEGFI